MKEKDFFRRWASQVSIGDRVLKGLQEIVRVNVTVQLAENEFQMRERVILGSANHITWY